MRRTRIRPAAAIVLGLAGAMLVAAPAGAETGDPLDRLVELNPGVDRAEMARMVGQAAGEQGLSDAEMIEDLIAEAESSLNQVAIDGGAGVGGSQAVAGRVRALAAGGGASITLTSGATKGDVFYSPISTLGVTHGHAGIYYTVGQVTEAPGPLQKSRTTAVSNVKVADNSVKQYVMVSQTKRNSAANYANSSLRNKSYNYNFGFNKDTNSSIMNCSQLVWAAYKQYSVDIDSNGGNGVYPSDIKNSLQTSTYYTF